MKIRKLRPKKVLWQRHQVVDHRFDVFDGDVLAAGVVEPAEAAIGLRILGRQGDHDILVQILPFSMNILVK